MANTFQVIEGFETWNAMKSTASILPTGAYAQVAGYETGSAWSMYGGTSWGALAWTLPAPTLNTTWFIASFMLKLVGTNPGGYLCGRATAIASGNYNSPSYCRMAVGISATTSKLYVQGDAGAVDLSNTVLTVGNWYHIEYWHRYGNAANGAYQLRVNGSLVLSGAKDNSGVVSPPYAFLAGGYSSSSASDLVYIDDVIFATTDDATPTPLGISKVRLYLPTSTPTGQWAGSDGDSVNNHLLVDDSNEASSDWVTATAGTGLRELYGHAAATGTTVHAAQVRAAANTDVVGTDDYSILLKSGATESAARKSLGAGGTPAWLQSQIYSTDPNTGTAWTKANFDASTFGVKS